MIHIDTPVIEKGTAVVSVSFLDENGETPDDNAIKSLKWSLMDLNGLFINDREDIIIEDESANFSIVLSGEDLAIQPYEVRFKKVYRRIIIEATYQSTLGDNLPTKQVAQFQIDNLPKVV